MRTRKTLRSRDGLRVVDRAGPEMEISLAWARLMSGIEWTSSRGVQSPRQSSVSTRKRGLPSGIEISHDDADHLAGDPRVALRNGRAGHELAVLISEVPVRPRGRGQPRAASVNQSRAFGYGDALPERPVLRAAAGRP